MSVRSIHQFAEKVALISDAGSPVGRAVAMQLALQGGYVIGLFPGEAGSLDELTELGTLAKAVNADASTESGANEAAAAVGETFGRLDLLVNCLKYRSESTFESLTEAGFLETVRRNLGSVQFLTRAVLPLMKPRPKPRLVNIAWRVDEGDDSVFEACGAGIVALTRSMRKTLPSNFRVNCVEVLETPQPPNAEDELFARRAGVAPDDVARAVLFLLSSESAAINGEVVKLG